MDYESDEIKTGYAIYNATDGVFGDPRTFETEAEAAAAASEFRERFRAQGYYKTADGFRIDPAEVELEIVPVTE